MTALCAQEADRNRRRLTEEEARAGAAAAFRNYRQRMETVTTFKYLGRLFTATGNDFPAATVNMQKARRIWYRFSGILGREGADPKTSGRFYLVVV